MTALDHPVVVMGVSGSGKSTVGAALAVRLRVPFEDGDDLHPQANVDKMTRGEALEPLAPDEHGVVVDVSGSVDEIVERYVAG